MTTMTCTASAVRPLDYRGVNREGVAACGRTPSTPADLTKALFDRRMRRATVCDVDTGAVVGEVIRHPGTGARTWWAAQE